MAQTETQALASRPFASRINLGITDSHTRTKSDRSSYDKFFDLTVLDLSLPEMDGIELIPGHPPRTTGAENHRRFRLREWSHQPRASLLGADIALLKPVAQERLLKTVRRVSGSDYNSH